MKRGILRQIVSFNLLDQRKDFYLRKKGHVELDPEFEMYREKGIISICTFAIGNCLLLPSAKKIVTHRFGIIDFLGTRLE
jgi:hypothetical protein